MNDPEYNLEEFCQLNLLDIGSFKKFLEKKKIPTDILRKCSEWIVFSNELFEKEF